MALSVSGINDKDAQDAYEAFEARGSLEVHVNRRHTELPVIFKDTECRLDSALLKQLVNNASASVHKGMSYYFFDENGQQRYINQKTLEKFTEIVREKYPHYSYISDKTIVSMSGDVEVLTPESTPHGIKIHCDVQNLILQRPRTFTFLPNSQIN